MSITVHPAITTGPSSGSNPKSSPSRGTNPEKEKESPEVKHLRTEQERLKQKTEQVGERIERMQHRKAADPNDDPMYLYGQIQPVLSDLRILKVQKPKTQLEEGTKSVTGKALRLYRVLLAREAVIDNTNIEKIKMAGKNVFESMQWDAAGLVVHLWHTYEEPVGTAPPGAPAPGKTAMRERIQKVAESFLKIRSEE